MKEEWFVALMVVLAFGLGMLTGHVISCDRPPKALPQVTANSQLNQDTINECHELLGKLQCRRQQLELASPNSSFYRDRQLAAGSDVYCSLLKLVSGNSVVSLYGPGQAFPNEWGVRIMPLRASIASRHYKGQTLSEAIIVAANGEKE